MSSRATAPRARAGRTSRSVGDAEFERIERAMTTILRRANLPRTHERLCERAGVSLDRAAYVTLVRVAERAPVRQRDLARSLGVDTSTASRQVGGLERTGLLTRIDDPSDGRACLLALSDRGADVLHRLREARVAGWGELLDGWSTADRKLLAELLDRLVDDLVVYSGGAQGT